MKKLLAASVLSVLGCATLLHADPVQSATSGVFVTGDAGYGILFTPDANLNPSTGGSFTRSHFVGSAGLGYNWALDTFNLVGLEADYFNNGQSTYNSGGGANSGTLTVTSSSVAILLSFTTIWNNGIDFFFKIGPTYVQQVDSFSGPAVVNGYVRWGNGVNQNFEGMGVIGLGYYIAHNLNLFTDVTYTYGRSKSNWSNVSQGGDIGSMDFGDEGAAAAQIKVGLSYQF
jgi:hypothetical protein